jgi:hypothetical protein
MQTNPSSIASNSEFAQATLDKESWTQVKKEAASFDDEILDGLQEPVWRKTQLIENDEVIESIPWTDASLGKALPGRTGQDIKTTVWYGKAAKGSKPRLKRNLWKGIQGAAAILLLEAVVLLSASSHWAGSWTQKMYGTGQADVWEVGGARGNVTQFSWRSGWRPLVPLTNARFKDPPYLE